MNATRRDRPTRVVVDTDTGVDDALALVWLATHPSVEVVAVGSTHGNCRADQAALNALRVLEACGRPEIPVAEGLAGPADGGAQFATHVHGSDGLGDAGLPAPSGRPVHEHAVDQMVRLGRGRPGELDLLALGPLTNLAAALTVDPEALARYRSVVVMGGAGVAGRGGPDPTLGVGDPNTAHDPGAARVVFAAVGVTMVGVDVTIGIRFDRDDLDRLALATGPAGTLLGLALPFYVRFHEAQFGPRTCCAHDAVAAAVLSDPALVTGWATGDVAVVGPLESARAVLHPRTEGRSRAVTQVAGRAVLDRLIEVIATR